MTAHKTCNCSLAGGVFTIFGFQGILEEDGGLVVNPSGEIHRREAGGMFGSSWISQLIDYDKETGNIKKLAYVKVSARVAVILFLDRCITADHFSNIKEDLDHIDIPGVKFGDTTVTVRVFSNKDLWCCTADENGNCI